MNAIVKKEIFLFLAQVLRRLSALSFSCSGYQICCLYILCLSLSLESPILVSPIYIELNILAYLYFFRFQFNFSKMNCEFSQQKQLQNWSYILHTMVSRFASCTRKLLWIRIALKNWVKNHLKTNYEQFHIHTKKDNLCFYKNSTNRTLTFISSKVVYFKSVSHINYSSHRKRSALPLNVLYHHQTIKLPVEAMAVPLHTWLEICFLCLFEKKVKEMGQSKASYNLM